MHALRALASQVAQTLSAKRDASDGEEEDGDRRGEATDNPCDAMPDVRLR